MSMPIILHTMIIYKRQVACEDQLIYPATQHFSTQTEKGL